MRLPNGVYDAIDDRHVRVYRADRGMTKFWNERRETGELRYFCGWYWYEEAKGRAKTSEHGPFPTRSAAYRDAYVQLALRAITPVQKTTQVRGSNLITMPQAATSSKKSRSSHQTDRVIRRRLRQLGAA